jgi:hypothetical protein
VAEIIYLQVSLEIIENIKFWFFKLQSKQKESKKITKREINIEKES